VNRTSCDPARLQDRSQGAVFDVTEIPEAAAAMRTTGQILGSQVDVGTLASTVERILALAESRRPAYVCFATAYMLVKSTRDESIFRAYRQSDLVSADGTPLAWCLRLLGHPGAECVSGPRTVPAVLRQAAARGIPVGFYGGRPETCARIQQVLASELPSLRISYLYSPPFRPLSDEEQQAVLNEIRASGTQILFIGLGSPKQDLWMHTYSPSLDCVCLGVGAAFEFLSGEKVLPPFWVQQLGLTWLIRLMQEPRRLIRRNLYSPVFVAMFAGQALFGARFSHRFTNNLLSESSTDDVAV